MERIANFIDGIYLEKLWALSDRRIEFGLLAKWMAAKRGLLRTYYYDSLPPLSLDLPLREQHHCTHKARFHERLSHDFHFEVRSWGFQRADTWPFLGRKNVQLSVDLVSLAARGAITRASILAGDSDFIPAIEAVKACGVFVDLFHGPEAHGDLLELCDHRNLLCPRVLELLEVSQDDHVCNERFSPN